MKDEIKDKIIEKHTDILGDIVLQLGHIAGTEWVHNRMDELKELVTLSSQLAKAGEEKPIIKKCRQCRFFDLDEHCEPCESCYPIANSNWQPR